MCFIWTQTVFHLVSFLKATIAEKRIRWKCSVEEPKWFSMVEVFPSWITKSASFLASGEAQALPSNGNTGVYLPLCKKPKVTCARVGFAGQEQLLLHVLPNSGGIFLVIKSPKSQVWAGGGCSRVLMGLHMVIGFNNPPAFWGRAQCISFQEKGVKSPFFRAEPHLFLCKILGCKAVFFEAEPSEFPCEIRGCKAFFLGQSPIHFFTRYGGANPLFWGRAWCISLQENGMQSYFFRVEQSAFPCNI